MKLTFGSHTGTEVSQLPTNYLLWIASQRFVADKYLELLSEVLEEIQLRFERGVVYSSLIREQLGTTEG